MDWPNDDDLEDRPLSNSDIVRMLRDLAEILDVDGECPGPEAKQLANEIADAIIGRPREIQQRDSLRHANVFRHIVRQCNGIADFVGNDYWAAAPGSEPLRHLADRLEAIPEVQPDNFVAKMPADAQSSSQAPAAHSCEEIFLTHDLCSELGGINSATLVKYVRLANVRVSRRGERDRRFTESERQAILSAVANKAPTETAKLAREILVQIESKSKAQN